MKEIRLYGELGKKFGKSFKLDVKTPREAINALKAVVKGFNEYFQQHTNEGFHVFIDKQDIGQEDLSNPVGSMEVIKIIPAIGGSGRFFKIILGIALLFTPFKQVGIGLIISGVAEILFAPPKPNGPAEKPENKPSYVFDGPVNTIAQGHCVPLAYGRIRTGSQVISAGLYAENLAI
jgi:predicted phage tail protein